MCMLRALRNIITSCGVVGELLSIPCEVCPLILKGYNYSTNGLINTKMMSVKNKIPYIIFLYKCMF